MADVFEQLRAASWRDIEFPVTRMRVDLAHDLVEHRYWGVDGARVEATGLAPLRFSFSAPLNNGIVPGKAERWSILYPNAFRELFTAMQLKESGFLQHPEFGVVFCKAEKMSVDWDATRRGGVDAELSFVQTLGEEINLELEPSPVQEIDLAALDLDSEQTKADLDALLKAKGLERPKFKKSFKDMARGIQGVVDNVTLLEARASGQIEAIAYQGRQMMDAMVRARDALVWPVMKDCEKIEESTHELKQNLLALDRGIGTYKVPRDTTMAGICMQLESANIQELIRLNPQLMASPIVLEGTLIRFYAAQVR